MIRHFKSSRAVLDRSGKGAFGLPMNVLGPNRHARRSNLPRLGTVWKDDLGEAPWSSLETHRVVIQANAGYDGGVWYRVRQGIEGVLVYDEKGKPVKYSIVAKSGYKAPRSVE